MKTILPILVLALTGCGFGLTEGAVPCGYHLQSQMEVWVDGKGDRATTGVTLGTNGAEPVGATTYMTCEQAMQTIDAALAIGDSHDFWVDKHHNFLAGMRLEFIGDENLAVIGLPHNNGETMNSPFAHDMAVAYGRDGNPAYSYGYDRNDPLAPTTIWPSAVTLAHEMIHVLQSDSFLNLGVLNTHTDKHCEWASVYAPRFADLGWAQFSSNFHDGCEDKWCSGSNCKDDNR